MRPIVHAVEQEYRRYKSMTERAAAQLDDAQLHTPAAGDGNTVAVLMGHLGGNLASRFTDFLTTDGEKPWRQREEEFARTGAPRAEVLAVWERGWTVLLDTLADLNDADLARTITIRGVELSVIEALQRSLAHVAYHTGQAVMLARGLRGEAWEFLTIPPGGSDAYNAAPTMEKPADHAGRLEKGRGR